MTAILSILLAVALGLAVHFFVQYRAIRDRFSSILSVDDEMNKIRREGESEKQSAVDEARRIRAEIADEKHQATKDAEKAKRDDLDSQSQAKAKANELAASYEKANGIYKRLLTEVSLLEMTSDDMSFGLYKPQFSFESSARYKEEIERIYAQKRDCIKNDLAIQYPTSWTVNNSLAEGKRMIKKQSKIMLRAFNGECDAATARVTSSNISRMLERVRKSFEAINDLGVVVQVRLTDKYLALCLAELRLTHEFEQKKQDEKEKLREDRENARQEEQAQREFERAERDALAEEAKFRKSIAAAREALQKASGEHLIAIQSEINDLENRMALAQEKQQQAVSMAQLTRMGHVYIISNIGAFGEEVFKIGMTRRLDPDDRIQELSGASVPFNFDIHAMIFSENAPALESAFHSRFSDRRLNLINLRKEYFKISLDEIEAFIGERKLNINLVRSPEAKAFRESEALRLKASERGGEPPVTHEAFPSKLF